MEMADKMYYGECFAHSIRIMCLVDHRCNAGSIRSDSPPEGLSCMKTVNWTFGESDVHFGAFIFSRSDQY